MYCTVFQLLNILWLVILTTTHTVLDVDELSVQYGIEITNKPVLLNSEKPVEENVLHLSSKHGQLYSCFLPQLPQEDVEESGKGDPVENVSDILDKSMNGTCLIHKKGWWTYKLCHKESITQYHVDENGDPDSPITTLGTFSLEDDWSEEEVLGRKPSEMFHSHHFVNGTKCDVTTEPRKTTVQYFCATKPSDSIIRIEEPATCEYIITVNSMKLCNHPFFWKKETKKQINLHCSPALLEHEFNRYTEKMNKKKKEVLEKQKELDAARKTKEKEKGVKSEQLKMNEDGSVSGGGKDEVNGAMSDISSFMKGFLKVLNIKSEDPKVVDPLTGTEFNLDSDSDSDPETDDENKNKNTESDGEITLKDSSGKPGGGGTLKSLNGITEGMIKRLERDSERMQKKSDVEREVMMSEFNRIRKNALKELSKSEDMLSLLETLKKKKKKKEGEEGESEGGESKKEIDRQIEQVRTLVDNLKMQIKTIDEKRQMVEEMERSTKERLGVINKKIANTKSAHTFAKSIEHMVGNKRSEEYFAKVLAGIFSEGGGMKEGVGDESGVGDGDAEVGDGGGATVQDGGGGDVSLDVGDDYDGGVNVDGGEKGDDTLKDTLKDIADMKKTIHKKKEHSKQRSKMVKEMLKNLKEEVRNLNLDMKGSGTSKRGESGEKRGFTGGGGSSGAPTTTTTTTTTNNIKRVDVKGDYQHTKAGLNTLVNKLKMEMGKINEKIRKEKEKMTSSDEEEREVMKETEKDTKDKMEVRVRTMDENSLDDDEFDKTINDNVRDEVKEATKKMEATVKKQLKDAGMDFGDNIKIKIITTKEKFDQFSNGKDVKLLSDDDASDFKDLLLGFLGGGKEKVTEEQRQKALEENYNFVLAEDEEAEETK